MTRIKLNLRQAVPDKLQTGRQIVAAMTNNPNFGTPHPPLADVAASITTLDEAYKAQQVAKADARTKTNVADDAEIQFDSHLRKLAAYVESIADKDETIIASAGMRLLVVAKARSISLGRRSRTREAKSSKSVPIRQPSTVGVTRKQCRWPARQSKTSPAGRSTGSASRQLVLWAKAVGVNPQHELRRSLVCSTAFAS